MKYDFVISPFVDPNDIAMEFEAENDDVAFFVTARMGEGKATCLHIDTGNVIFPGTERVSPGLIRAMIAQHIPKLPTWHRENAQAVASAFESFGEGRDSVEATPDALRPWLRSAFELCELYRYLAEVYISIQP